MKEGEFQKGEHCPVSLARRSQAESSYGLELITGPRCKGYNEDLPKGQKAVWTGFDERWRGSSGYTSVCPLLSRLLSLSLSYLLPPLLPRRILVELSYHGPKSLSKFGANEIVIMRNGIGNPPLLPWFSPYHNHARTIRFEWFFTKKRPGTIRYMPFMIDFINAQFHYICIHYSLQLSSNLYMHSFPTYHHSRPVSVTLGGALRNTAIDLRDRGLAEIFRHPTDWQCSVVHVNIWATCLLGIYRTTNLLPFRHAY